MTLSIRNLDAPLGTEVSGIDLSKPVALGDVETIEKQLMDEQKIAGADRGRVTVGLIEGLASFGENGVALRHDIIHLRLRPCVAPRHAEIEIKLCTSRVIRYTGRM